MDAEIFVSRHLHLDTPLTAKPPSCCYIVQEKWLTAKNWRVCVIQDIDLGYSISADYMQIKNYPHIYYMRITTLIYLCICLVHSLIRQTMKKSAQSSWCFVSSIWNRPIIVLCGNIALFWPSFIWKTMKRQHNWAFPPLLVLKYYYLTRNSASYRWFLSSSCEGRQHSAAPEGPFGPKGYFAGRTDGRTNRQTNNGFKGVRYTKLIII